MLFYKEIPLLQTISALDIPQAVSRHTLEGNCCSSSYSTQSFTTDSFSKKLFLLVYCCAVLVKVHLNEPASTQPLSKPVKEQATALFLSFFLPSRASASYWYSQQVKGGKYLVSCSLDGGLFRSCSIYRFAFSCSREITSYCSAFYSQLDS